MATLIGPSFGKELVAAGLNVRCVWEANGAIRFDDSVTTAERAAVMAVFALHNPLTPLVTPTEREAAVLSTLNGGSGLDVDIVKLLKAKFISDLAFRLGVAPGALTPAQLAAERNRIATIYKAL